MLNSIIQPAIANLEQAKELCTELTLEVYADKTAPPYFSSIGSHLRHILDVYQCVINACATQIADLTDRKRGTKAETDPVSGLSYLNEIIVKLGTLEHLDPCLKITIKDDLGQGMVALPSTIAAALNQAHSHAIHHYACIGYLLHIQGAQLPNKIFGYNPTTPKNELVV